MCRLFGFRSVIKSHVHRSLLSAENALAKQSENHPDGWGVTYYVDGHPHLIRNTKSALEDQLFQQIGKSLTSQTVLAHVRKATMGNVSVLNCHPFQFGPWVFAHNGEIPNYSAVADALHKQIEPSLVRYVFGQTDSEVIFYLFLSELFKKGLLSENFLTATQVIDALKSTIANIKKVVDLEGLSPPFLTLVISNGQLMVGLRENKELYYSTHKGLCLDKGSCTYFSPSCESPAKKGDKVSHFLLSSEPLFGENMWQKLDDGDIVAVDEKMRLCWSKV